MGKLAIRKPHNTKGVVSEYLNKSKNASVKDYEQEGNFIISLKNFDKSQGLGLKSWEQKGDLAEAIDVLINYCQRPLDQQCDNKKFVIYGDFPKNSSYSHPQHVPLDAKWARIHINGKKVIAGHVYRNIFYVVFLDHDHSFYISPKKHT